MSNVVQDPTTGRYKKKVGQDGVHEIFRWMNDGEVTEWRQQQERDKAQAAGMDGSPLGIAGTIDSASAALSRQLTEAKNWIIRTETLLASHGVKVVQRTDGEPGHWLMRLADNTLIDEPDRHPNAATPEQPNAAYMPGDHEDVAVEDTPAPYGSHIGEPGPHAPPEALQGQSRYAGLGRIPSTPAASTPGVDKDGSTT